MHDQLQSKIEFDREGTDRALTAMIGSSPLVAVRGGLIDLVFAATDWSRPAVTDALAPVCALLGVESTTELPLALKAIRGRPPRLVARALRSRPVVDALGQAFSEMGLIDRMRQVEDWLVDDLGPMDLRVVRGAQRTARRVLVDQYRVRVVELMTGWREQHIPIAHRKLKVPAVDGRALVAASRAWQVPELSPSSVLPTTTSASAKHANRLGRAAGAVAASRVGAVLGASQDMAPVSMLEEAFALLVAVAESITVDAPEDDPDETGRDARVTVALGAPVGVGVSSMPQSAWWPVLDSWGSTARGMVGRVKTVWRCTPVESDVLVWALCNAACRLAVVASAPTTERGDDHAAMWAAHFAATWPMWDQGAQSVWALLNQSRLPADRGCWPGVGSAVPTRDDPGSWPWRALADDGDSDRLPDVPADDFEESL